MSSATHKKWDKLKGDRKRERKEKYNNKYQKHIAVAKNK